MGSLFFAESFLTAINRAGHLPEGSIEKDWCFAPLPFLYELNVRLSVIFSLNKAQVGAGARSANHDSSAPKRAVKI